jgi:hypothetical protein
MSEILLCITLFVSLKNVHIEDVDVAANYWLTQFINSHNNKMWVNSAGILANSPKSYSVTKNNILHKNLPVIGFNFPHNPVKYGGIGIGINYLTGQSTGSGTIEDNEIFVKTNPDFPDAVCAGVVLSNSVNALVRANDIRLQNDYGEFNAESRFYGVYKSGGYDNTVCGNDIKGLNGYDRGIGSSMSPGNSTCNHIQYTRAGFYFVGDNEQNNGMSGNEIADTYAGIYVNSPTYFQAILGEQDHQANKWVNNWVFGGKWDGNQDYLDESKFLNNIQYPYSPNVEVEPSYWFEPDINDNLFTGCLNDVGQNTISCNVNSEGEGGKLKTLASNANKLEEPYRSMVLRKAYAQIIADYHNVGTPPVFKNFLQENSEKGFAKLAEIDYMISHPLADFPILEQEITAISNSIQEKIPDYLAYQKTLDDLTFLEHSSLGSNETNVIVNEMKLLSLQLESKVHLADSIRLEHLTTAIILNNGLSIENQYIDLEQKINVIYLNMLISNQENVSYEDSIFIKNVAYYCPQDYGDAVFKSRGLWVQMGNSVDKAWDDCFPEDFYEPNQNRNASQFDNSKKYIAVESEIPIAYPIPLSDILMVNLPLDYVGAEFEALNAVGISIIKGVFNERVNSLDATSWNNGIFYINIKAKNKRPITLKVIVQKL